MKQHQYLEDIDFVYQKMPLHINRLTRFEQEARKWRSKSRHSSAIMDEEWSVVGKKEKKGSPKAQKSKGVKRTELQRSSSMNQVNSRRKLEANKSVRIDKEDTAGLTESEGTKSTRRKSSRLTKAGEEAVANVTESTAAAQDTITTIIDDVSSGIKRLSIDNRPTKEQIDATKYSALVGAEPRAALLKVMSTSQFCELCRHFNPTRPATGKFLAR